MLIRGLGKELPCPSAACSLHFAQMSLNFMHLLLFILMNVKRKIFFVSEQLRIKHTSVINFFLNLNSYGFLNFHLDNSSFPS